MWRSALPHLLGRAEPPVGAAVRRLGLGGSWGSILGSRAQARQVTVWPQWPYDASSNEAKPVGDPRFRWPPPRVVKEGQRKPKLPVPQDKAGALKEPRDVERARNNLHRRIWAAMYGSDWGLWERSFWEMRDRQIPYDEASYIFLAHGYVLSHRHSSENAFMALEEMRRAEVHPALVRLQQNMLNSAFELKELGVQPPVSMWLHVIRLSWHCAGRLQKTRRKKLQAELEALPPDEALALESKDVQQWIRGHDTLSLPPDGSGIARFKLPPPARGEILALPQGRTHDGTSTEARLGRGRRKRQPRALIGDGN